MKKWSFTVALLMVLLAAGLYAGGQQEAAAPATQEPTVMEEEDWDAIYAAGQNEGKVVIYSLSSRIFDVVESFKAQYPGVDIEASDMTGVDQIEKLTREQAAGIYNVDVLFLANYPTLINELLPDGLIVNYVPETLVDGTPAVDVIPKEFREPLLVHSLESKVTFYNFQTYPDPPVDSLWDLTRKEWRGKVQMKDPLLTEENMNYLQATVQHADAMAAAYQREFGEPIELSRGCENAGYEFILRLAKNDLVLTTSDGDAAKAVGAPDQSDPPLTISVASSKLRYNDSKGTKLAIAWNLDPMAGLTKRNFLVMANKAPHPNAAKLLIRWMLGDEKGSAGMEPFVVPGGWPSRTDVPPESKLTLEELQTRTWFNDAEFIYEHGLEVRDFWLSL
jgi:iron(III) transport system substrate-binding protein